MTAGSRLTLSSPYNDARDEEDEITDESSDASSFNMKYDS